MKTLALALLLSGWMFASGQSIAISPVMGGTNDPVFGRFVLVYAEQLADHSCSVQVSIEGGPWQEIAGYGCYPETQWVIGNFPVDRPWARWAVFRSVNSPCPSALDDPLLPQLENRPLFP